MLFHLAGKQRCMSSHELSDSKGRTAILLGHGEDQVV